MLSSIVVKFIFDSVSLGDKGLFSFANVFQIADVAVKLSSCCSCYVFSK